MWMNIGFAAIYGALGVVMAVLGYKVFDLIDTRVDYADEIKKGNIAAAIVIAGFLIGICYIIGNAIG